MRAFRLKLYQTNKGTVVGPLTQCLFGVTKHLELAQWQINPSSVLQVFVNIPNNIRELKCDPQLVDILLGLRIPVSKNFNAHEPNRAGDTVTVSVQCFEILEPPWLQVHLHTKKNLFEKPAINLVFTD